jgi:hypothetical protein
MGSQALNESEAPVQSTGTNECLKEEWTSFLTEVEQLRDSISRGELKQRMAPVGHSGQALLILATIMVCAAVVPLCLRAPVGSSASKLSSRGY